MKRGDIVLLLALVLAGSGVTVALGSAMFGSAMARSDEERARIAAVTAPTAAFGQPEKFESNSGGAATTRAPLNSSVFSQPSGNMSFERQLDFRVGDGIFRKLWVSAPSSTLSSDGLGPLFNARSCQSCHLKDGRGRPPAPGEAASSMFLRLSVPPRTPEEKAALASGRATVIAEPVYGGQLQNFSIQGLLAEGEMAIEYEEVPVRLAGGETVSLRNPTYALADPQYGPPDPELMLSPRIAPAMIGMGLLEAVPAGEIEVLADPDDADGDGISGRANMIWDREADALRLGRFGWKAGQPSVAQQTADAFAGDIGLSSALNPSGFGDCREAQAQCRERPHGGDAEEGVEVPAKMFELTVFYARNLGVPARRDIDDPQVLAGKRLFYESGCTACHNPKFVTARDAVGEEQSFQLIWPYSDLLLHDMGEGLADHRPEGRANGREWRTAPLWGIGLTDTANGNTFYLHDGRARSLLEAILWHGGEAQAARDKVAAMAPAERAALLAFLRSL